MPKITEAPRRLPPLNPRLELTPDIKQGARAVGYYVEEYGDRRQPEPPAGAMMPDYPSTATTAPQIGETPDMSPPAKRAGSTWVSTK